MFDIAVAIFEDHEGFTIALPRFKWTTTLMAESVRLGLKGRVTVKEFGDKYEDNRAVGEPSLRATHNVIV